MADALDRRVVFVTGGARGLGAAICEVLAAEGAIVAVGDLDTEGAQRVAAGISAKGGRSVAVPLDVGDDRAPRALEAVAERYGGLDVLVNNAGIDYTLPIEELSVEEWDAVLRTNLRGPFLLSRCASRLMRAKGAGHIVNIVSTASKRTWPNASAYHASKWGLLGLSHALHAELRPFNIKVSALIAGGMRTEFLLGRFPDIDRATLQDPASVAAAVKFLLLQPEGTVIPELMVLPMRETSWP